MSAAAGAPTISSLPIFDGDGAPDGLNLRVALRIDQAVHPVCRGERETHRHQLAGRRWQFVLGRLALQMGAIGIGDDQAGVLRKDLTGQLLREGKEQPVAMGAIVLPFLIGPQILQR